jgi:hypothetical protein
VYNNITVVAWGNEAYLPQNLTAMGDINGVLFVKNSTLLFVETKLSDCYL